MDNIDLASCEIPSWVPKNARRKFQEISKLPNLIKSDEDAFSRLITSEEMKKIWAFLKKQKIDEEEFLQQILFALTMYEFFLTVPEYGSTKAVWKTWSLQKRKRKTAVNISQGFNGLGMVLEVLGDWKIVIEKLDVGIWENKKNKNVDELIDVIEEIRHLLDATKIYYESITKNVGIKTTRNNEKGKIIYFSNIISKYFITKTNDPKDNIVSIITSIVFNIKDGIGTEKTRSRRK